MNEETNESPVRRILPMLEEAKRANEKMQEFLNNSGRIGIVKELLIEPGLRARFMITDEPDALEKGRSPHDALPYVDPLDDVNAEGFVDVLEDVLDDELLVYMMPRPQDELDVILQMEAHVRVCEQCADLYGAVTCHHCLERRICELVAIVNTDSTPYELAYFPLVLQLCRQCRTSAREGALELDEGRA